MPSGEAGLNGDTGRADSVADDQAADAGEQVRGIPNPSADAVRVCTYTASGQDLVVDVYRDQARTAYTLVSRFLASPIVQPIGVANDAVFTYQIERNHTLFARMLANDLLRFADVWVDPSGPGSGFQSFCSADGIQIRQASKDPNLYLELIRADNTSYRVDLPESWTIGVYFIRFYSAPEGATTTTELGAALEVVSRNPDNSANLSFIDLDGRRVSIDITSYGVLLSVRIVSP